MFSPILIIYYIIIYFELNFLYNYAIGFDYVPYGRALSIVAGLFLVFPLLVIAFTFTPITYEKNEAYIRWTFLFRLYKRYMSTPHDGSHWGIRPKQISDPNSALDT